MPLYQLKLSEIRCREATRAMPAQHLDRPSRLVHHLEVHPVVRVRIRYVTFYEDMLAATANNHRLLADRTTRLAPPCIRFLFVGS